jgi:hypothetical protein
MPIGWEQIMEWLWLLPALLMFGYVAGMAIWRITK